MLSQVVQTAEPKARCEKHTVTFSLCNYVEVPVSSSSSHPSSSDLNQNSVFTAAVSKIYSGFFPISATEIKSDMGKAKQCLECKCLSLHLPLQS